MLAALLFWGVLWEILSRKISLDFVLPGPLTVLGRFWELVRTAEFYFVILQSFLRIILGFAAAVIAGTALAFACRFRAIDALISPLMAIIRATPVASFIIVVILLMDKEGVPAFISFLMVLPIIWQNVRLGIRSVDPSLMEMARVFQVKPARRFWKIEVPSILPHFRSAVKMSIGLAWKAGVAAEVLAVPKASIGTMIFRAKQYLESADLYAWTLAIILISVVLEKLFALIWKKRRSDHASPAVAE